MVMLTLFPGLNTIIVDIVLVHGLSGHPNDTWFWFPSTLWPRDFLPFYPSWNNSSIRVLSFGYDGNPQPTPPAPGFTDNDINAHSNNLLQDLVPERRGLDNNRPIIFVGHGLGGLIIKDALNKSRNYSTNSISSDMAAIGSATIGVLFLSTPHRGTAAGIWDQIASFYVFGEQYRSVIIADITGGSPTLVRMETEFNTGVIDRLEVFTFYEEQETALIPPAASSIIVDRASARIGHKNERELSLKTSYEFMTKYDTQNNESYKRVADAIFQIYDNHRKGLAPDGGTAPPITTPGLTISDLRRLRDASFKQSAFSDALDYQQKLVALLASTNGPDNRETLLERTQTAALYGYLRDFTSARNEYNQALLDMQRVLGMDDPDTLRTMAAINNLPTWQYVAANSIMYNN